MSKSSTLHVTISQNIIATARCFNFLTGAVDLIGHENGWILHSTNDLFTCSLHLLYCNCRWGTTGLCAWPFLQISGLDLRTVFLNFWVLEVCPLILAKIKNNLSKFSLKNLSVFFNRSIYLQIFHYSIVCLDVLLCATFYWYVGPSKPWKAAELVKFPVTNLIHLTKTRSHLKSDPYSVSQNKSGPISEPWGEKVSN